MHIRVIAYSIRPLIHGKGALGEKNQVELILSSQAANGHLDPTTEHLDGLGSYSRVDLLSVLVESNTRRWSSYSSSFSGSHSNDLGVNGAGDAVVQLVVQLRESVLLIDRGIGNVPDRCGLNHVSHCESLDSFVLGHAS